jgi:hypothetical protein
MAPDEHDEITYAKILAAAEEIRAMARHNPAEAAAMFAQARHLFELAEQIRSDWLRGRGPSPGERVATPERDRATATGGDYGGRRIVHSPE